MRTLEAIAQATKAAIDTYLDDERWDEEGEALLLTAFREAQAQAYAWDPQVFTEMGSPTTPYFTFRTEDHSYIAQGQCPSPGDLIYYQGTAYFILPEAPK